mmetsp:Transcript_55834/g.130056  ORF Transcript_55834/g.130056 Transcript_55834/m.130056 type:complete len:224 (-) Transcript_55834:504-1175(-)
MLHHRLECPLGKVQLPPVSEDHANAIRGVMGVLLVLQCPCEVPQGLLHVYVPVGWLRQWNACNLVVQIPQENVRIVELLLASATDCRLCALQSLRVVRLVPVHLSLHQCCQHGVALHCFLVSLHGHPDLTHTLPLCPKPQERVSVAIVLLVDCHVLLRGFSKIWAVARALCQPSTVEAHGEVRHLQVLGFFWTRTVAFQLLLCKLQPTSVGLLGTIWVTLKAP